MVDYFQFQSQANPSSFTLFRYFIFFNFDSVVCRRMRFWNLKFYYYLSLPALALTETVHKWLKNPFFFQKIIWIIYNLILTWKLFSSLQSHTHNYIIKEIAVLYPISTISCTRQATIVVQQRALKWEAAQGSDASVYPYQRTSQRPVL